MYSAAHGIDNNDDIYNYSYSPLVDTDNFIDAVILLLLIHYYYNVLMTDGIPPVMMV